MTELKMFALFTLWLGAHVAAYVALFLLEAKTWPVTWHWHPDNWRFWLLALANTAIIRAYVWTYKTWRKEHA